MSQYEKMREKSGMKIRELAAEMKSEFPKISLAAISLAERSDISGVQFTGKAGNMIRIITGCPRTDKRTKPCKYTLRLLERDSDAFNSAKEVLGHRTNQEAFEYAAKLYIEKAALAAVTAKDGKSNIHIDIIHAHERNYKYESI